MGVKNRVEIMHGVNFNMLGVRNPELYGGPAGALTLSELEYRIDELALPLGLELSHFQTNFEGDFVEHLHKLRGVSDGLILNPGAWTHYSWAIRDALEIAEVPAVEVHLSDIYAREEWRAHSTISELCIATISGQGVDGYREALELLGRELSNGSNE